MTYKVQISNYEIGTGQSCFVIAEAGVNHNGEITIAHKLIDKAFEAGADAIKFQSFITEELITPNTPKANYQIETTGNSESQFNMLKSLELSNSQQIELQAHCDEIGILYLCTPYDTVSADNLDRMNVAAFKIASTDVTNIPFLRHIARKNRPVILSTGMSTLAEVELAINTLKNEGLENKIILLQCTAEYPAPLDEINLRAIHTMRQAFNCPVGFSDHTEGIDVCTWAVSIGAAMVEKHFTLNREMVGPDHRASLEPDELAKLVQAIRNVEASLGDGIKRPMPSEIPNKARLQKSIVANRNLSVGDILSKENITCKRPGTGLPPHYFERIIGKKIRKQISTDELITYASIDWEG